MPLHPGLFVLLSFVGPDRRTHCIETFFPGDGVQPGRNGLLETNLKGFLQAVCGADL